MANRGETRQMVRVRYEKWGFGVGVRCGHEKAPVAGEQPGLSYNRLA